MGKYRRQREKQNRALLVAAFVVVIFLISAALIYTDAFGIRTKLFGTQDEYSWAKTDTVHWDFDNFADHYIYGAKNDPVSGHTEEVFSKTQYIGSWKRTQTAHASETLIVEGKYGIDGAWLGYNFWPKKYWYVISWSDSLDGPWTTISKPQDTASFVTKPNPGTVEPPKEWWTQPGWRYMESYDFEITGDYKNYIRVQVKVKYKDQLVPWDHYVTKTATDICRMLNGEGELWLQGDTDLFEEGEDVTFVMDTGYSGKSTGETEDSTAENLGWTLTVYNPDGDPVKEFTDIPDDKQALTRTWTVPSGSFDPSWNNIYRAVLRNSIIDYDEETTFIIDEKEKAPSRPDISFSGGDEPGEEVMVTLESTPNEETGAQIDYFMADVYYVDGVYIKKGLKLIALNNRAQFTFTPTVGGSNVVVSASAHDTEGRPSGASEDSRYIKHPYEEDRPWWHILQEYWWAITLGGAAVAGGYLYYEDPMNWRKERGKGK